MTTNSLTLGIDPAKEKFTVCLLDDAGQPMNITGDYPMQRGGFEQLRNELRAHLRPVDRLTVGIEASGALDDNLLVWLSGLKTDWSMQTLRVNAAMVTRFSAARPLRAKTDGVDARRTAQFTRFYAAQLEAFEHDAQAQAMGRLVNERAELVEQQTALTNRLKDRLIIAWPEFTQVFREPTGALALTALHAVPTAAVAARKRPAALAKVQAAGTRGRILGQARAQQLVALAKQSIASARSDHDADAVLFMIDQLELLRRRIEQIERDLEDYQTTAPTQTPSDSGASLSIPAQIGLIAGIRGIGTVGAATVVLRVRGLSRFTSGKALAAQLAVCPERFQTGRSMDRGRLCRRGDRRTRPTLYLLALMMTQFDPAMAFHCWRMKHKGLTPKQAVAACMNRLARLLWAMVSAQAAYDPARAIANARHHHPELWKTFVQLSKTNKKLWKNLEHLCVDYP
jgi:transposase